jgi:hypothetical protein
MSNNTERIQSRAGCLRAAGTGVTLIALVAMLVISTGCIASSNPGADVPPAQVTTVPVTTPAPGHQAVSGKGVDPSKIVIATPVAVPGTGVFVRVNYPGAFTGTYSVNGTSRNVQDSGYRLYTIEDPAGVVTATFKKSEGSRKQNLTVEIWENGKLLISDMSPEPYGRVIVSSQV